MIKRLAGTVLVLSCLAVSAGAAVRADSVLLMDIARAGGALVGVGERGTVLRSDDGGGRWAAIATPVTRALTALAFDGPDLGIAVGHGGTILRSRDGGRSWATVDADIGLASLLGVTETA